MDPALLFSVISSQAGTQGKAVLEAVMNSIDAGASKVKVEITEEGFVMEDDGKGFADKSEIVSFFETFGTPHKEGDAVYGKFRMGRGQIFNFGANTWETGQFKMTVDIKNLGLDYNLSELAKPFPGCKITGQWYDVLKPSGIDAIVREVKGLVAYAQIPVFLNGTQINKLPAGEKWDVVSDDAYIKLKETGSLDVYNLGVLVRSYPSYQFGTGGVVVSRKQLEINFARNDILVTKCLVWKSIQATIKPMVTKKIEKKATRITEDERRMLASQVRGGELDWNECSELRLLTDICGNQISLNKFMHLGSMKVSVAESGDKTAIVIHERKMAFVLNVSSLHRFGVNELSDLIDIMDKVKPHYLDCENLRNQNTEFNELNKLISNGHTVLQEKELDRDEVRALRCLEDASYAISGAVAERTGVSYQRPRKLFAGVSDVAQAWTDGSSYVVIHRRFLKQLHTRGWGAALKLVQLLVHELLHDDENMGSHTHDETFYEEYHDILQDSWAVCNSIDTIITGYAKRLRKEGKNVAASVKKAEDAIATTDLEKAKALGFSSVAKMHAHFKWLGAQMNETEALAA